MIAFIILTVLIVLVILITSGKKKSEEDLNHLIQIIYKLNDQDVIFYGIMRLIPSFNSSRQPSKEEIIHYLKNNWHTKSIDRQKLIILDFLIIQAKQENDENKKRYLDNERLNLMMKMGVMK